MFKFCPNCTKETKQGWKCCPYCGYMFEEIVSSHIEDNASVLDGALDGLINLTNEMQERQLQSDKIRVLIIRGKYDEAKEICNDLIDKDPMDKLGYMGLIRVVSKNYTIEPNAEVTEQIRIATDIFGEDEILLDEELAEYIERFPIAPEKQAKLAENLIKESKYAEAVKWLNKSTESGHAHSYYLLAQLYENGTGVKKDIKKAMEVYTKAAEAGDKSAIEYFNPTTAQEQYRLGLNFYLTGNYDGAKWWLETAGKNRCKIATYYLGVMYEEGKGVTKDEEKAYSLYTSVKTGCQEAWNAVERIDEQKRKLAEQEEAERKRIEKEKAEAERKRIEAENRKKAEEERIKRDFYIVNGELKKYKGKDLRVTIPSVVTSIGYHAFCDCSSLISISIPSGVTIIEAFAFEYCSSLTSVTFGYNSQLTIIDPYAFADCVSLKSVTIPYNCQVDNDSFPDSCKVIRR